MSIYYQNEHVSLYHGDCLDQLAALPDASVDAVVTDPPYGLSNTTPAQVAETITRWVSGDREYLPSARGFMGHEWDGFVPPVAVWDECLRVLKPGGHLLAFAGSRTQDLMGLSVRLAGFEIRDSVAWLYGSGFPKSLNVSTAVDRALAAPDSAHLSRELGEDEAAFCRWVREESGLTAADCRRLFGSDRFHTGRVEIVNTATAAAPRLGRRAMVPTAAAWATAELDAPEWVRALVKRPPTPTGQTPGDEWVKGRGVGTAGDNEWQGWGTALKPAHEPIILARKPLDGTVAANVLEHGTGALNIDGCRIATDEDTGRAQGSDIRGGNYVLSPNKSTYVSQKHKGGRWPANVVLDEHMAGVLDEQVPKTSTTGKRSERSKAAEVEGTTWGVNNHKSVEYTDSGGASRFFYVAKAPKSERPMVDGTAHPTVKPLALMEWLVRMVTPPGGTVLDPFAGSGTTLEAAAREGFSCIGIERQDEYLPLIHHRIQRTKQGNTRTPAQGVLPIPTREEQS